jgi:hypothetical protein
MKNLIAQFCKPALLLVLIPAVFSCGGKTEADPAAEDTSEVSDEVLSTDQFVDKYMFLLVGNQEIGTAEYPVGCSDFAPEVDADSNANHMLVSALLECKDGESDIYLSSEILRVHDRKNVEATYNSGTSAFWEEFLGSGIPKSDFHIFRSPKDFAFGDHSEYTENEVVKMQVLSVRAGNLVITYKYFNQNMDEANFKKVIKAKLKKLESMLKGK